MAIKQYEAVLQTPDGKHHPATFDIVNFDGDDEAAKKLYEELHGGTKIVSLQLRGLVNKADTEAMAAALARGEAPPVPTHLINPDTAHVPNDANH